MPKEIFIWELPKRERLKYYKRIKAKLIKEGEFSYENLAGAMSNKIVDLPYDII